MIKTENIEIWGFEHAIRGMRNPYESWDKSDSHKIIYEFPENDGTFGLRLDQVLNSQVSYEIGPKDLKLAKSLFKGGTEHRKYLRQIFVSMDITAPLYWWKEFDTYKVGTVANSSSTMHLIAERPISMDDFSCEHLGYYDMDILEDEQPYKDMAIGKTRNDYYPTDLLMDIIDMLNHNRNMYKETGDKKYWWQIIQLLPSSYNQKRTVTMNYENVATIIKQRSNHKLDEWRTFIWVLKQLPYVKDIMLDDSEDKV